MKRIFPTCRARVNSALLLGWTLAASTAATPMPAAAQGRTVFAASGAIAPTVAQFRKALGAPDNGGVPGSQPTGRRELSWDGVPDQFAAPNFLPGDYFNAPAAPRARGAVLSTPGTGVQVSADSLNPGQVPVRFGHINLTYTTIFKTFSPERLFSPVGSNIVDLRFYVPGTQQPALVRGFGAVYTDVDRTESSFTYFNKAGQSLGQFRVPAANNGLSFLGVAFDQPVVARVQIRYGSVNLGPNDSAQNDVAVMDDFIYGEPQDISLLPY
jgi:hypothetical protein